MNADGFDILIRILITLHRRSIALIPIMKTTNTHHTHWRDTIKKGKAYLTYPRRILLLKERRRWLWIKKRSRYRMMAWCSCLRSPCPRMMGIKRRKDSCRWVLVHLLQMSVFYCQVCPSSQTLTFQRGTFARYYEIFK